MAQLFTPHSKEQHAQSLADLLPNGPLYGGKNVEGTNFRDLLTGLAIEFQRCEQLLNEVSSEYDIKTTENFIEEWERAVGIPDSCFSTNDTIENRRLHVLIKIAAPGVNTRQDFINLAAMLGFDIDIQYLPEVEFYPPYDVPIDLIYGIPESRYVWIVVGAGVVANVPPYDVPFSLIDGTGTIIQCLFEKLKPAQTKIIYRNA